MPDEAGTPTPPTNLLGELLMMQAQGAMTLFGHMMPQVPAAAQEQAVHWAELATRLQTMWTEFQVEQISRLGSQPAQPSDPVNWMATAETVLRQLPLASPDVQHKLWDDSLALVTSVLAQYGLWAQASTDSAATAGLEEAPAPREGEPNMPYRDPRFAAPEWRRQPFFAVLHQLYLLLSQRVLGLAEQIEGLDEAKKRQLVFATRALVDAVSPANFPLTNPVALERALETRGESLMKGMENLLADLRRGQLTHTDLDAFRLGENIAATPGKVVHETPLFQLIQYAPATENVLKVPLVIFPPWINRFYILDLSAKKSFVRWAVDQGITVFMVSWRSADASMADIVWDDYISAQIEAIDIVRERLGVPSVHTIGYCVAGTTLAATLAILARKGEAHKVTSATFFTAQVDFAEAGDLRNFVDDSQLEALSHMTPEGFLDGRYLAATFNLLRGNDLIWSYVEKNYLKGEERPAFDLLHWNGDVTNLPARWHRDYMRDFYRDNRLVEPDSLSACGVSIDLRCIETPCYIQAGREDHIAPPHSVWKLTRHLSGPWTFILAGSGHIAGVVNPPAAGKYQYWTNEAARDSLESFTASATEHPGSWWPHWRAWLEELNSESVPATGKRQPGAAGDAVIEDAPGRYVALR